MSLDQWQVVVAPAGNTAGEFGGLEAGLLQLGTETTGMLAKGIDQNQGFLFVLVQLGHTCGELVVRNMQGIDDMPGAEFLLRANVDYQRLARIDQCGQLTTAQGLAALAQFG